LILIWIMNRKGKILSKLAFLLLLTGIILTVFTWVGFIVDFFAFLLLIYVSRWTKISWVKVIFYSLAMVMVIFPLLMKYHMTKIKFVGPQWQLIPSAQDNYIDPLYQQRIINFNFDSLMTPKPQDIKLIATDSDMVPPPAPGR